MIELRSIGKEIFTGIILAVIFLLIMGLIYGWYFPAKPSVLIELSPNHTEILGFTYAKYPGTLHCASCVQFYAQVKVYYKENLICEEEESVISLGKVILPIRCNKDLKNYEGKEVKVIAIGKATPAWRDTIETKDEKILNLTFIDKK